MKQNRSGMTELLGLLVFTLFALCLLGTLLSGAAGYQRLVQAGEERFTADTAVRYLAARVRQADTLRVEDFEGRDALVLEQEINGAVYLTRVYCWDGYLCELFSAASAQLQPEDGEKLVKAGDLKLTLEGNLLRAETEGKTALMYLRSGRQVSP